MAWILEDAFRARGLVPSVRFHITDQHTLLELAAEGVGVGVSTRPVMARYPELALTAVEAADAPLKGVAVAAWTERGIRNKAVQALVQHAQAWARARDAASSTAR